MEREIADLASLANELEMFIQSCVPESFKVSKYGGTLFTLNPEEKEGQYCGVFLYTNHVQLSFSKGAQLGDERKMLQGSGKFRRHINFTNPDEIDYEHLKKLLMQAASL